MKKFSDVVTIMDKANAFPFGSQSKRYPSIFAHILVADCSSPSWWYKDLIGEEFFCELRFSSYIGGRFLSDAVLVKLTNTTMKTGQGFHPNDIIIQ